MNTKVYLIVYWGPLNMLTLLVRLYMVKVLCHLLILALCLLYQSEMFLLHWITLKTALATLATLHSSEV